MSLKQWKYTNGYEPYETLPEVNSEDNGKVLGVAEGNYALVSGGGGSSALVVDFAYVDGGDYDKYLKSSETGENIVDAYESGTMVIFKLPEVESFGMPELTTTLVAYCADAENYQFRTGADDIFSNCSINKVFTGEDGYVHIKFYID